jgi:type IV secretory pathway VirD2 relaxase
VINESYDDEDDSLLRLQKIIKVMKQIQTLSPDQKNKLKEIADYNRRWFFSDEFHNVVAHELQVNLNAACVEIKNHIGSNYRKIRIAKNKKRTPTIEILQENRDALSWIRKNRRVKKISK